MIDITFPVHVPEGLTEREVVDAIRRHDTVPFNLRERAAVVAALEAKVMGAYIDEDHGVMMRLRLEGEAAERYEKLTGLETRFDNLSIG